MANQEACHIFSEYYGIHRCNHHTFLPCSPRGTHVFVTGYFLFASLDDIAPMRRDLHFAERED